MTVSRHHEGRTSERGIALIAALLILVLLAIAGATFMSTTSGERSMASNVQVSRASLLAADAGVRTQQQVLANLGKAKLDSLLLVWAGTGGPIITSPANIFPTGTLPAVTSTSPNFTASATISFADSDLTPGAQVYNYNYSISATGTAGGYGQRQVQSTGILRVSAERGTFADYLMYTDVHLTPSGGAIWFTSSSQFDGRVHTNGEFRFAFQPGFHDQVTSVNQNAWYYNNNNPLEKNANSNGTIDVPDFFGGFKRNQTSVTLPPNSYDQQSAALGLSPTGSAPTNAQIDAAIGQGGSSTPNNGIYLINSGGAVTGGLYIQGDLDQCKAVADTVNHKQQYVLKQGGTTKTINIDTAANSGVGSTSITVGGTTTWYTGVPRGVTYCNGEISDLRGPDRSGSTVLPAIEHSTQMLFTATGDIVLQRDLTCEDFDTSNNIAGLYSSGGDIRIGTSAPNDMNVDAFVMAASTGAVFTVDNYGSGSPHGTFHLRGGCTQDYYGAFFTFNSSGVLQTGYARDFHYDRRGLVPPYFPSTNRFNADQPSARTLAWKEI